MMKNKVKLISTLFICLSQFVLINAVMANPSHFANWLSVYENSDSDLLGCQLCHGGAGGGQPWNAYGWDLRTEFLSNGQDIQAAFSAVENLNSDNDSGGSSNIEEILANAQPGWTEGSVNTLYFSSSTTLNQPPPSTTLALDPEVSGEPTIGINPDNIDFGFVAIGSQLENTVTISNTGSSDLIIASISNCAGTSNEFQAEPLAIDTIPSGEDILLSITYAPVNDGLDEGCLSIASNDPNSPLVEVALFGTGFDAAAELLDVDIESIDAPANADINGAPILVQLSLVLQGSEDPDPSVSATLTGTQNGVEVYSETQTANFSSGSESSQTLSFPTFVPTVGGDINWVAVVLDEDADIDEAFATTMVGSVMLEDPIPETIAAGDISVRLEPIADGLVAPNYAIAAPGIPGRLFVVDQPGIVWNLKLKTGELTPFLDLSAQLIDPLGIFGAGSFDERGLLGLAFHPDYEFNGLVYTFSSEPVADFSTLPPGSGADHQGVIAEWRVDRPRRANSVVNPFSKRILMRVDQPQFNHNGGTIAFGPDNYLYISFGDGGGADDVDGQTFIGTVMIGHGGIGNGQDPTNPLGAILRIDPLGSNSANGQYGIPSDNPFVEAGDPRLDEIFAYGFRNVYRMSFDSLTGELYGADVGQNDIEEVNIVESGGNYGWNLKEGSFFFDPNGNSSGFVTDQDPGNLPPDLVDPILEYDHDEGISVTGGFVYRGSAIEELQGRYVFGDWSSSFSEPQGRLFYGDSERGVLELNLDGGNDLGMFLHGFGQDSEGELYVLTTLTGTPSGNTGAVLRIVEGAKSDLVVSAGAVRTDGIFDITSNTITLSLEDTGARITLKIKNKGDAASDPYYVECTSDQADKFDITKVVVTAGGNWTINNNGNPRVMVGSPELPQTALNAGEKTVIRLMFDAVQTGQDTLSCGVYTGRGDTFNLIGTLRYKIVVLDTLP